MTALMVPPSTDATAPVCGAKTRPGAKYPNCRQAAGWGTNHVGQGRCKLHGGNAGQLSSGRYTTIKRPRVKELIEHMEQDPDPLNMKGELFAARAMFVDFLERYDEWREGLLAWYASWSLLRRPLPEELALSLENVVNEYEIKLREYGDPTEKQLADLGGARRFITYMRGVDQPQRPHQVLDPSAAMSHIDTITKVVERIEKVAAQNAISRKDLFRLTSEMGRGVMRHVTDPEILKAIRKDWLEIRLGAEPI